MFDEKNIELPQLDGEPLRIILEEMSEGFDWSGISPTIFGAVFESTLNPETRHSGGMHYTSIEIIHKVIDPLFLNDLNAEFENIFAMSKGSSTASRLTISPSQWVKITEAQMWHETKGIIHFYGELLPLKSFNNIIEANALKIDWREVVRPEELNIEELKTY